MLPVTGDWRRKTSVPVEHPLINSANEENKTSAVWDILEFIIVRIIIGNQLKTPVYIGYVCQASRILPTYLIPVYCQEYWY